MVVDLEKVIELEREDRLRPRLRDRTFGDWMYFIHHPLHQHDVELFTYYFNIGLMGFAVRCSYKYAVWVKSEFFAAKSRDDVEIERRMRAAMAAKLQQQQQSTMGSGSQNQQRQFSTMVVKRRSPGFYRSQGLSLRCIGAVASKIRCCVLK